MYKFVPYNRSFGRGAVNSTLSGVIILNGLFELAKNMAIVKCAIFINGLFKNGLGLKTTFSQCLIEPVLPLNTAPKIRFRFEVLNASSQICVIA